MTKLTVIHGGSGGGQRPPLNDQDAKDNAYVIEELEKWVERAKRDKIVSFVIAAVATDGSVSTQYAPARPSDVFKLHSGGIHAATRVYNDTIWRD